MNMTEGRLLIILLVAIGIWVVIGSIGLTVWGILH